MIFFNPSMTIFEIESLSRMVYDIFILIRNQQGDGYMSGLKSSWELSLERSEKLVPELKNKKKITNQQKEKINDIRREYQAKIADKDVMMQDKLIKLHDRIPPDEIEYATVELQKEFADEKKAFEEKMEEEIESIRN